MLIKLGFLFDGLCRYEWLFSTFLLFILKDVSPSFVFGNLFVVFRISAIGAKINGCGSGVCEIPFLEEL